MRTILSAPAWPYANGPRHIGHVSGFALPCDMFSRYQRMAGNRVLMVSGTDEHGTPIQVQADAEGVSARELADRYNRVIVNDLTSLGMTYDLFTRTTTLNHYAVTQEIFVRLLENGYIFTQDHAGRDLAVHRADAARPLHRGHVPDLRLPERPRRPVRQLRQPARPGRPDQPPVQDQRRDAGLPRDRALLPGPARVRRGAGHLAAGQGGPLAAERAQVLPQPPRRPAAAGDNARPGLGRARSARRLAGPAGQADLRLVRRGDRVPVRVDRVGPAQRRPGRLAGLVERAGRRGVLLHGQGQHRLPLRDLAGHAARLQRARRARRPARPARHAEPADRGGLERVPDHGGPQVLLLPRGGHLRQGLPGPLRRGRAALLRGRGRPGEPGHRLHLERVRPPQQRRAGRDLGQPGQPRGLVRGQEHRLDPGGGRR